MAQYQTVAPWIRFEWKRASADVSSRWQTRAKLERWLIENWEARNGVGSGTAIQATFQGRSFRFRNPHTYHLGFQHVKDIWICGILDDIGRIHFFGFMLLVDQLNGCLCLSMESTWPLQGWLCPNLQPGDEDFRYFFKCIFHISKEISFGWGTDASFSSEDWDWTGRSQICSEGTCAYSIIFLEEKDVDSDMFRQKSNSDSYPTMFGLIFTEASCYLHPYLQSDLGCVGSSVWNYP